MRGVLCGMVEELRRGSRQIDTEAVCLFSLFFPRGNGYLCNYVKQNV